MAKVLIAAGGTGGHIYPALAIAEAFRQQPDIEVEFVGTAHGLENKLIPPKGFALNHLNIGRLNQVSWGERLRTLALMPWAFVQSARLLRRKRPAFVLGVGGHASGPLLLVASLLGYRTAIWEPNAMPGLANRWLSRFVDECWVVFKDAGERLKTARLHVAGMPIRAEIEAAPMATSPAPAAKFRLLVFGGSQGARGINNTVLEMVKSDPAWLDGVSLVHQTGPVDFARIREGYGALAQIVDVREYLYDMEKQYAAADLVVCRSGTGTLSELAACGKAAILIPFPFAADDHQRKNAESLVADQAAVMIVQKDLTAAKLRATIDELRADPARRSRMQAQIRKFHRPAAAQTMVRAFVERMNDASR